MPKYRNVAHRGAKASPGPPGGRRSALRLDAQTEHFADEAEGKGLKVFRGVTVLLSERSPNLFQHDFSIGVVVPRSSTFGEFVLQAVKKISKAVQENKVQLCEDDTLENVHFFVGPDDIRPLPDASMYELEEEFKGEDEFLPMHFDTTN